MSKYKGKNKIKSVINLATQRAKYNVEVEEITDFHFAEKILYGKVDRQHNPVITNNKYLKPIQISTSENPLPVFVMNFVTEQFLDFERYFTRGCQLQNIAKEDPVFSALSAKNGHQDPIELYKNYYNTIMELFVDEYLLDKKLHVNSFEDFGGFFISFMSQLSSTFPITLSGFQRSSHSGIFTSGLALDIAGLDFDDDEKKQQRILDSTSYEFFIKCAHKFGFSINKRNPGVLVSDIKSPATSKYLNKYGLWNTNNIFDKQYTKTLYHDISLLSNILLWSYNYFVENNRMYKKTELINNKVVYKSYKRQYINNNNIDNNYILYLYINIRNIEENLPYNKHDVENIVKTSNRIKKKSYDYMLEYVDDQFKSKYTSKDGTLSYYKEKLKKKFDKSC